MKVWMIWARAEDGATWLESAWDDDSTAGNHEGWQAEVERVRKLVAAHRGYEMRIMAVVVPGVHQAFQIPEVEAKPAR